MSAYYSDMQKVLKIFLDCGRKKAGIPFNLWKLSDRILCMTVEILQLMYEKDLKLFDFFNYVANLSVFLKINSVTSHALLRKFMKMIFFSNFKLSACLLTLSKHYVRCSQ